MTDPRPPEHRCAPQRPEHRARTGDVHTSGIPAWCRFGCFARCDGLCELPETAGPTTYRAGRPRRAPRLFERLFEQFDQWPPAAPFPSSRIDRLSLFVLAATAVAELLRALIRHRAGRRRRRQGGE